jgi:hypothetical protein
MSEDIALPRRARWPWITGFVIAVAAAAAWWALAPHAVDHPACGGSCRRRRPPG